MDNTNRLPNLGVVASVRGSVVDVRFDKQLPPIYSVLRAGTENQIVPLGAAALRSAKLVRKATLKIYAGAPHGLAYTHKDQLNAELLAFLMSCGCVAGAA